MTPGRVSGDTNIRFFRKDGQSVAIGIARKRFFDTAVDAGVKPNHARAAWYDALQGDTFARELIEELCGIEIVDSDTGFGFL
jgi:hypothetical protein